MKVSVCATKTYYYEVEVPDHYAERDEDGQLKFESHLLCDCAEADPTILVGEADDVQEDVVSVWAIDSIMDGAECLYTQ